LLLPLLITTTIAHFISVLILKRSILTEKVARRGFHVLREYEVNTMDTLFVRDVMITNVLSVESGRSLEDVVKILRSYTEKRIQRVLPVVEKGKLLGLVLWQDVMEMALDQDLKGKTANDIMIKKVVVANPDESLAEVADRMSVCKVGVLPVVEQKNPSELKGLITQYNLLDARSWRLHEEEQKEKVLHLSWLHKFMPHLFQNYAGKKHAKNSNTAKRNDAQ